MARKWWTLAVVSLGVLMLLLDLTIVNVALPRSPTPRTLPSRTTLKQLHWTEVRLCPHGYHLRKAEAGL